jgi:hypothetical protein
LDAPAGTVVSQFWDTNTVWVPLSNGNIQQTTFNDNLNPLRNQYRLAPWQWFEDASALLDRLLIRLVAAHQKVV